MTIIVQYHLVEQDQVRMSHQEEELVHHVRQVDLDLNQLIILDHQQEQVLVVEEEVEVLVA